jgi:hypothetical protein
MKISNEIIFEKLLSLPKEEQVKFTISWQENLEQLEIAEAVRRGLETKAKGMGRPAEVVFAEICAKLGIPVDDNL